MSLFITADGSHSIESEQYGVPYHSRHGALQETRHVFIEAGLLDVARTADQMNVLGIGFGTGLNAFVTLLTAEQQKLPVSYHAVEAFPLSRQETRQLNYPEVLEVPERRADFLRLHDLEWEATTKIAEHFEFSKEQTRFQDLDLPDDFFDVVYFDAFAPNAQPELWDEHVLGKMYRTLRPGGVLVTYCAKGSVKRCLRGLGFTVEPLPGPPRKREMTRARK